MVTNRENIYLVQRAHSDHRFARKRSQAVPLSVSRLRAIALATLMLLLITMMIIGPELILPSQAADAKSIASLSTQSDEVNSFDGYAVMAFIYASTTPIIRYVILIVIAFCFFRSCTKHITNVHNFTIFMFLCVTPIILFLCYFVKDTFYLPFMLISLAVMSRSSRVISVTCIVMFIYILYAFIFRSYFIIIATIFAALVLFRKSSWIVRLLIITSVPVILLMIPDHIYILLQEQRDFVNRDRIGYSGAGNRTAFLNYMRPDGLGSFFFNYGYAIIRLNLPIIFNAGFKEAVMMSNIVILAFFLIRGISHSDMRVWRPALLFLAHFFTLMIFEPDLGSYLRHITTSLPLLAPTIGGFSLNRRKAYYIGRRAAI